MSKDYSRLKRRLKTAIKEGKAFNPPVLLGDTGKRAACLAWAGNVIDMLNNSDLGNEPHHLAVGGRGSLVIALEDQNEELFNEGRAEIIAAAESVIRVIEEMYEDHPDEPPKVTTPVQSPSTAKDERSHSVAEDPALVFVVYGRNIALRDSLFSFLRALHLKPIEWSEAVDFTGEGSPHISTILDAALERTQAVVVLLSPDDVARLRDELLKPDDHSYEREPTGQARPNVLFEAGMAFGRLPDRTILVEVGSLRPFSDVGGRHTIKLDNSSESRNGLAKRLERAGCSVSTGGEDWLSVGDFEVASPSTQLETPPEEIDARIRMVKFRNAYDEMPDLIEEMKEDVDREPFVKQFVLVKASLNIRDPHNPSFVYDPYQHESLQGKIHILEEDGFVIEVSRNAGLPKKYKMTKEFVKLLRSSIPNHPTEIADQDSPTSHQNEEWYQYLMSDEVLALDLMTADLIHARLRRGATPDVVLKEALKVADRKRGEAQKLIASAQRDLDLMKDNPVEYKLESALRRKKIAEENRERFDKAWIRIREYFEYENFKLQS